MSGVEPCVWCGEPDFYHFDCPADALVDESPLHRQRIVAATYANAAHLLERSESCFMGNESFFLNFAARKQRQAAARSKWERCSRGIQE
jgi:hypothetical protein